MIAVLNVLFQMLNSDTSTIRTSVVHTISVQLNIIMWQEQMSMQGSCTSNTCISKIAAKSCHVFASKREQHVWQTAYELAECSVAQLLQGNQKHIISEYFNIHCFIFKITISEEKCTAPACRERTTQSIIVQQELCHLSGTMR